APAARHQQHAGYAQAGGDQAREEGRPDRLAGDLRVALDGDQHGRPQQHQQDAEDGVIELHLAIPTAFIVAPSSASDLAMNLPKSSGPAYTTPKPRLAMKSWYSLPLATLRTTPASFSRTSAGTPLGA